MRDIAEPLTALLADGEPFALAVLTRTWRSAPRPAGTAMAVDARGAVVGSLSGGCVEGAVYELATQVLADGQARVAHYGVSGEDAFAVGLTCGGELDVVVLPCRPGPEEQVRSALAAALSAMAADRPTALCTLVHTGSNPSRQGQPIGGLRAVETDTACGSLGSTRLDEAVADDARGLLAGGRTDIVHYGEQGRRRGDDLQVFVASYAPRPRLIVFGAIDFARAVARLGSFLGFHVTVCDARAVFATSTRFPEADEVVCAWPHRYLQAEQDAGRVTPSSVITVLTHDPKFDVPLLEVALRTPARYIGAMGSRRTHAERLRLLRDNAVTEGELTRLRSPIGLDLGARTPEETAVSILAEVIAGDWHGTGRSLSRTDGPIHHDVCAPTPPDPT